jgi:hypothetical protein
VQGEYVKRGGSGKSVRCLRGSDSRAAAAASVWGRCRSRGDAADAEDGIACQEV